MASKKIAKSLKRSALTVALGLCFVGGVQAQTNTSGAVTGQAISGDTITIVNPATGFSRTITVAGDGSYRFSALPIGQYTVTRKAADGSTVSRPARVNVGTAANVNFVSTAGDGTTTTLDTITVIGTGAINPIDVSSVESTTILTAEQIEQLPVARNITTVALLAPGTVRGAGNAGFGNLASFGGSSVVENQYFLNGFNITNSFKNLNFAQIPFEAIAEQQIKTGGYGAEFGRSTGGVINLISKRGTNEFHAGGNVFYTPESLSETSPDLYYNDGRWISDNSKDNGWEATAAVWASGALIKDRLFAYGLIQYGVSESDSYPGTGDGINGGTNIHTDGTRPQWLLKMDWNISDNHVLELTAFSDKREFETPYYNTTFGTAANPTSTPTRAELVGTDFNEAGGTSYVAKYTGYLTDNFTLTALAGHGEFSRSNYAVSPTGVVSAYYGDLAGASSGCPIVIDARTEAANGTIPALHGCYFVTSLGRADAKDTRDQYRIDAEWILGDHLLRGGIDIDNFSSVDGSAYAGGGYWRYVGDAADKIVRFRNVRQGADIAINQRAFYIQDTWSVTDNFMAYLGLRWDTFENENGQGEVFVDIENQFAPRLGFSWDVNGDSTFKVFGNAGRYALPLVSGVATRAASASIFSEQFYTYTSIDPVTNAPIGLTPAVNPTTGSTAIRYLNGEDGQPKYAVGYATSNLEPMYQDEFILGFQKELTDNFSLGVRGIRRDLKRAIDDQCDYGTVIGSADAQGFGNTPGAKFNYCFLFNPGEDAVLVQDFDGDGDVEEVTIPGELLSVPAKRKYTAIEFFWQGNWDRFFMQGSYTYARAIGNTEGGVRSDNGQDDTGTTSDFDYLAAMIGAYGYNPNDRRHTLKMFGNYDITDEWSVGANLLIQSGRPISCIGVYKGGAVSRYGNIHFSCDPGIPDATGNNGDTIIPRGTVGRTPWTKTLDLNVAYRPEFAPGLQFKVDVFNVFNSDSVTSVNEVGESSGGDPRPQAPSYLTPTSWQTPRTVRFMVQYDF